MLNGSDFQDLYFLSCFNTLSAKRSVSGLPGFEQNFWKISLSKIHSLESFTFLGSKSASSLKIPGSCLAVRMICFDPK